MVPRIGRLDYELIAPLVVFGTVVISGLIVY